MRFDTLALHRDGPVVEIRLGRPDRGNPIDDAFVDELERATAALHDDASVRAVLLTSDGAAFSRGEDGESRVRAPSAGDAGAFRCLETLAHPVIAVVEGDAIGAGLELALACDIRIAAEDATFSLPQVEDGRVPSMGGTQRLPRLIGRTKAAEMILLGTQLDARAALVCGLVNHIGTREDGDLIARTIAQRGPLAVRYAKEAILRGLDMPLEQALRYETDLTVILQTTADRAEGVKAFLEKRDPKFEGK